MRREQVAGDDGSVLYPCGVCGRLLPRRSYYPQPRHRSQAAVRRECKRCHNAAAVARRQARRLAACRRAC